MFKVRCLNNNSFKIDAAGEDGFKVHRRGVFGVKIEIPGGNFIIDRSENSILASGGGKDIYFVIHSRRRLVESYVKRLKIEPATKKGSIIKINLEGTNMLADITFLTKLTDIFLNISLDKKNNEAIRTIQFIDDQLAGISDSLLITENKLQQFRSRNRVMNLSAQGQVIIDQAMKLENEKARLGIESGYYVYLSEYLSKEEAGEAPVSPATMGITDAGLTKLVADLQEAQAQLSSKSMGDKNPLQGQLSTKVKNIKEALKEILKGVIRANTLSIKENQEQVKAINSRATALPGTERELLGIERKYKLNDELYTFLLEKRAVAQMQKASNVADNEIIDYPETENSPVWPKKEMIYSFALFVGISIPLLWLFLASLLDVKINEVGEINKITDLPVTGYIPRCHPKSRPMVLDEPDSSAAEAFRLLRSKMKFLIKDIKSPVILITSSMAKEGKTLTAVNLASAYSLMGRKTILIDFDLRQPKVHLNFGLDNRDGLSNWLIGNEGLGDIIKKTSNPSLHFIASGPIPPNPAELTALEKISELLLFLKKTYDFIIIDTSPIGMVSDCFPLTSFADATIVVVRQNLTSKVILADVLKDLIINKIKSISLVLNDLTSDPGRYGYRGSYMHSYRREQGKNEPSTNPLSFPGIRVRLSNTFRSVIKKD